MIDRKPEISKISRNTDAWRLLSDNMQDMMREFIEKLTTEKK